MDFNKLGQQASSFLSKQQNSSSNQGATDPNVNTNTGGVSNTGSTGTTGTTDANMSSNQGAASNTGSTDPNAGNLDYGDKGLDFIEKKSGHTFTRDQNEKITDGARGLFEKFSGKKVDSKYSN